MEEHLPAEQSPTEEESPGTGCANCGQPALEGNHAARLCGDCRAYFIRFPIPLWIRVFAGGICIVLLFSLFTLPKNLSLGIHLEKGIKAGKEKNYFTAEKELKSVLEKAPDNLEAKVHLTTAAFYNQDFETLMTLLKKLSKVRFEDQELFSELEATADKTLTYIPNDSFGNFTVSHPDLAKLTASDWEGYFLHNPDDNYAAIAYSSELYDRKEYETADSVLQTILKRTPEYGTALMLETNLKREQHKLDEAAVYCNRMLSMNHELPYGLAIQSRILLQQKKDKQALDLALKNYKKFDGNYYVVSSLMLAYHFNGRIPERDALVRQLQAAKLDSLAKTQVQYALDVIAQKEKFRD